MRVRLLGPLEVVDGDRPVVIGGPMDRRLLAVLAVHAGHVVSESRLIDALWGDAPPRTATKTLQNYVLRLRRALQAGTDDGTPVTVVTVPPGYELRGPPDAVDATAVAAMRKAAAEAAAAGDHRAVISILEQALACWRGPSLVEFAEEPFAIAEAARLDDLRAVVAEERMDARLASGDHRGCVAELEALIADNPLRERAWGQLMLAMYRSGRQADALRAYQRARSTLVEALGIEPSRELRRLESSIIEQDPGLDLVQPAAADHDQKGQPRVPPGILAAPGSLFVGRHHALERLAAAWTLAGEGHRQVVVIRGEPGVGKTSLARVFAAVADDSGGVLLYGRCDEELTVPYQPFAEALRWYVARTPPNELAAQVGSLGGELVRLVPEVSERIPGLPEPVSAEPEVERYRLFEAVMTLLGAMSVGAPVLLFVDDLQWAADSTLLLLRHIVRSAVATRLLVVVTCRDAGPEVRDELTQRLAELHREPGVQTVALGGLDQTESIELVTRIAGQELDDTDLAFLDELHVHTGGNPFFMDEILRHLADIGTVYRHDERWRMDCRLEDIELPEGVLGILRERLSRLSGGANRALDVGAVAGNSFSLGLLEGVPDAADDPEALLDALDEAVRAQVVVEVAGAPDRYSFAHALLRQAIRQHLTAARRARLHRRIGFAYEAMPDVEECLGALAHHFAEGGDTGRAADYALRAARQAMERLAFEVAVVQLGKALRCIDAGSAPDRRRRTELLLALAEARRLLGDGAGARTAAREAAEDARAVDSPALLANAAMAQAGLGVAGQADPDVGTLCEEALALLGPDPTVLRVQLLSRFALHRAAWEGQAVGGGVLATEALGLARRLDDTGALTMALFARGITLAGSHQLAERQDLAEELMGLAQQSQNRRVLARGLRLRALARLQAGDVERFDRDLDLLEDEATKQRNWMSLSDTARWRTMRALLDGRFQEVEECSAQMLERAGSDANAHHAHLCQLFFLRRDQGRLPESFALAEQGHRIAPGLAAFRALFALALLDSGRAEDARQIFDDLAADGFAPVPRDFTWPASLALLAMVCGRLGDLDRASELLQLFTCHAGQLVVIGWGDVCPGAADRYLGVLEATLGRWDDAESHYRTALALESRIGARPLLVHTRVGYAELLRRRDRAGDEALAAAQTGEAQDEATSLGMTLPASGRPGEVGRGARGPIGGP